MSLTVIKFYSNEIKKIVNVTFFCHSGTEVEATVGGEGGGYGGYGYGGYSGGYGGGYSMPNSNYSYYG